ncbi:MAG TPA: thioredoxin family protein [Flavobacterium sp.]|jgi:thioredoxin 1
MKNKEVIRFTADWCGPCKHFAPTFDKVSEEFKDSLKTTVADVGSLEGNDLARKYGILGIPAVVFLLDGEVVSVLGGNQPTQVVQEEFKKLQDK